MIPEILPTYGRAPMAFVKDQRHHLPRQRLFRIWCTFGQSRTRVLHHLRLIQYVAQRGGVGFMDIQKMRHLAASIALAA